MAKYKINIDKKLPSKEETKSYQAFDTVLNDYEEVHKPHRFLWGMLRNFRLVKLFILINIVVFTVYFSHKHREKTREAKVNKTMQFEKKDSLKNIDR